MTHIPLFPLHAVLCPGIAMPLNVFEPRYRLMVERCIEDQSPFGIVLIRDGREVGGGSLSVASVGTFAEIREAARTPDGSYELLVVGTGRFTIEEVDLANEPYLVGRVASLDEPVGDAARAGMLADRAMRRFVRYLQLLQPQDGEIGESIDVRIEVETEELVDEESAGEPLLEIESEEVIEIGREARDEELERAAQRLVIPDDPTTLSYLLSGIVQVELSRRQALLEAGTTEERLETLDRLILREVQLLSRRLRVFIATGRIEPVRRN
jgi:Lon protease-like protein